MQVDIKKEEKEGLIKEAIKDNSAPKCSSKLRMNVKKKIQELLEKKNIPKPEPDKITSYQERNECTSTKIVSSMDDVATKAPMQIKSKKLKKSESQKKDAVKEEKSATKQSNINKTEPISKNNKSKPSNIKSNNSISTSTNNNNKRKLKTNTDKEPNKKTKPTKNDELKNIKNTQRKRKLLNRAARFTVTPIDSNFIIQNYPSSDSNEDDYISKFFSDDDYSNVNDASTKETSQQSEKSDNSIVLHVNETDFSGNTYDCDATTYDEESFADRENGLDEYFGKDDYSDNSDYEYDIDDDDYDESFDSGSIYTDEESVHSTSTDDTYDRFLQGPYEDDSNDADYISSDVYIRKGDAILTKLDDESFPFSDTDSLQIVDLNELNAEVSERPIKKKLPIVHVNQTMESPNVYTCTSKKAWKVCPIEPIINQAMQKENYNINKVAVAMKPILVSIDMGTKVFDDSQNEKNEIVIGRNVNEQDDEHEENITLLQENCNNESTVVNNDIEMSETHEGYLFPPKFINGLNSRHVLMVLKDRIYFHGILSIKVVAGCVEILGYKLNENEMVTAYSPRGHSFLYLNPILSNVNSMHNVDSSLDSFKSIFLKPDLEEIKKHFCPQTDAILLLERAVDNSSVSMIKKYMKQVVFPNATTLSNRRTFYTTEYILSTQFMFDAKQGIRISRQWEQFHMHQKSRFVAIGGKGVGKSTVVRYLINRNLERFQSILLIDLDIGQPELFLPQTISASIVTKPILGSGYLYDTMPLKSYLYGHINAVISPIAYFRCVYKLLDYLSTHDECLEIPWVINTMGYNRGFGLELIVAVLKLINPTDLIQINGHREQENFDRILNASQVNTFNFNILTDEMKSVRTMCDYDLHVCATVTKQMQEKFNKWDITPKDLRYATILSKLGGILQGNTEWLTDVKPVCASMKDLQIIVPHEDPIKDDLLTKLINGSLVYLCQKTSDSTVNNFTDIVECCGIGIVRNVDFNDGKVYLLPAIPVDKLSEVNALAICSIPLPISIVLNQSKRINGNLPYVYNNDDFIGSKQVVQISYRPQNKSIQLMD